MKPLRADHARPRATLVLLAAVTALPPLSIDLYTPSLPQLQHDLGASDVLAQATITACLLGIGLGQLFWGPLADRHGRRRVILLGTAGWTVASLLSAMTASAGPLIALRFAAGLCGAAGVVAARSAVRDITPEPGAQAARIGMLSLVSAAAPIVAPLLGVAVALAGGWRADFVALAALGAVLVAAFAAFVPETLPVASRLDPGGGALRTVGAALGAAVRDRDLLAIAAPLAVFALGFYAYVAAAAFIVEREFGMPAVAFGIAFGTNALAMVGANLVFRRLVRRRGPRTLFTAGLAAAALSGAGLLAAGLAGSPPAVSWAASLLFAASAGFVLPGAHASGQTTSVASGAASALTGAAQFLGGVLGSPLTGALGPGVVSLGAILVLSAAAALAVRVAWGRGAARGPAVD